MPKIKQLLLNNLELKIFSVILAVLIWYIILGQEIIETMFYVPIEFQNLPKSLEIVGDYRKVMEITLKGPSVFLNRISPHDVKAILDLSGASRGEKSYYTNDFNIDVPLGLTVTKTNPPSMKMVFDMIARREVPINVVLQGNVINGSKLASISVTPKSLLVEGPQRFVDTLQYVNTDPININGLHENAKFSVSISGDTPNIRLVEATNVLVELHIEDVYAEKVFDKIPITANNKNKVKSFSPSSVNVVIQIPMRMKQNISSSAIRAELHVQNLAKGKHSVPIMIVLPASIKEYAKVISLDPPSATVTIK